MNQVLRGEGRLPYWWPKLFVDGEQLWVGMGLVMRGENKFLSSFKDKTFRCLLSEEAFIPDEVRKSG